MSLLDAKDVSISLGNAPVLSALSFSVGAGELVGLIGPNGAGKTTLLRLLVGLLSPESGEILLDDRPLQEVDRFERARKLAYLPQDSDSNWAVTVETVVMMGRLPHRGPWRGPSRRDTVAVASAIESCDVAHLIARPVTTLSGGERARVLLARALAVEPRILLADEPVSGLDPAHQLDVMRMLRDLAIAGTGVVIVMHDLTLAARYCHRLAILHDGAIAAQGSPSTVLSAENLARYYGIRAYRNVADGEAIIVPLERVTAGADHVSR